MSAPVNPDDERPARQPRPSIQALRAAGRGTAKSARVAARGARGAGRVSAAASRGTLRIAHRLSNAQGAGETGLGRLIEVHGLSMAGDAAVTLGLAGTLFVSAQPGEAKSHVALFLILTMLPFSLVAPLIGPMLDRYRHGRRWAMGGTLALRAFLCWVLAGAIEAHSTWQFPAALGILVASKAYLVTRSSATPRLLPSGMTLVKANGRLSLAGVVGATVGGALAGGASLLGATWAFRAAFLLFVCATIVAILLPAGVDSDRSESVQPPEPKQAFGMPAPVVAALRANVGLRWISGFLTMFLAFLMKIHPLPGWEDKATQLLGLVAGAVAVGNALGTVAGSVVKSFAPRVVIVGCLIADAVVMVWGALDFTIYSAVGVALVAGLGQQLGKLSLDSLIQDHLEEAVRTSGFARSETLLQLAWVLGGIFACIVPTSAAWGMYSSAFIIVTWAVLVLLWNAGRGPSLRRNGKRAQAAPETPASAPQTDERPKRTRPMKQSPVREPLPEEAYAVSYDRDEYDHHESATEPIRRRPAPRGDWRDQPVGRDPRRERSNRQSPGYRPMYEGDPEWDGDQPRR